ncbi:MAG: hypothetical protein CM15mP83_8910 [Flavobacteriaceae bacterium]|nr:MAG: hypothetical protein CM15mP83_8910 [Flavobacteriaceae bacterium]
MCIGLQQIKELLLISMEIFDAKTAFRFSIGDLLCGFYIRYPQHSKLKNNHPILKRKDGTNLDEVVVSERKKQVNCLFCLHKAF